MLTYQDFEQAKAQGQLRAFIAKAINDHRGSNDYKIAVMADQYDRQLNPTINETVRKLYNVNGRDFVDFTASNNRIASNFFRRLNRQRATYSLGNGITFDDPNIKEKLGSAFDTDLFHAAYDALKHGKAYGFWNINRLHVFPFTQFVPLLDESDSRLRVGIRYWCMEWDKKPVYVVLYEEDGYTKYISEGKSGLTLKELEPKRAYKETIQHTEAEGDAVIGEENYGSLPIVPLYANTEHQSTLVGMRAAIDSYDLIQSGFANDLQDCAQIYWIIGNALGMDDADIQQFRDRMKMMHVVTADTDHSNVTPYTQEVPYSAREAYLNRIAHSIYRDFGVFNPEDIAAGNVTATQINAAYQPQDEEADAFEYQIITFVQQILALQGLEGTPIFKRNRVANQLEQVQMVIAEAEYLDRETILNKLPNITPDEIEHIMQAKDMEDAQRFREALEE